MSLEDVIFFHERYAETRDTMANTLLPLEERNLTPEQVEQLDRRRRRGQLFLVLCLQTFIIGTLVTVWSGTGLDAVAGLGEADGVLERD